MIRMEKDRKKERDAVTLSFSELYLHLQQDWQPPEHRMVFISESLDLAEDGHTVGPQIFRKVNEMALIPIIDLPENF